MDVRIGKAIGKSSAGKNFALKRNKTSRHRISHPLEIVNKAPHFLLLALPRIVNQPAAISEQNIGAPIFVLFSTHNRNNTECKESIREQAIEIDGGKARLGPTGRGEEAEERAGEQRGDELLAEEHNARVLRRQDPEPGGAVPGLGVVVLEQSGEAEEEAGEVGDHLGEPAPRLGPGEEVVEEERQAVGSERGQRGQGEREAEVRERVGEDVPRGDAADVGAERQRPQRLLRRGRPEERAAAEDDGEEGQRRAQVVARRQARGRRLLHCSGGGGGGGGASGSGSGSVGSAASPCGLGFGPPEWSPHGSRVRLTTAWRQWRGGRARLPSATPTVRGDGIHWDSTQTFDNFSEDHRGIRT